jgi:hypothetical protein
MMPVNDGETILNFVVLEEIPSQLLNKICEKHKLYSIKSEALSLQQILK